MTTDERLDKLEKELARAKRRNRRLLAALGLAAGAFALVWIVAGTANRAEAQGSGVPTAIRANAFVLVDENGKMRARLSVNKNGVALALLNRNGIPGAALTVVKGAPGLTLYDENAKGGAVLAVGKDGPGLTLFDENGKADATLAVLKGEPGLSLLDEKGKDRAVLAVGKDGPGLALFDENGKGRAMLGAGKTVSPDGRKITYPESSLRLFGPDETVVWQAP